MKAIDCAPLSEDDLESAAEELVDAECRRAGENRLLNPHEEIQRAAMSLARASLRPETPELVNETLLTSLEEALPSLQARREFYGPSSPHYSSAKHSELGKLVVKCEDAIAKAKEATVRV